MFIANNFMVRISLLLCFSFFFLSAFTQTITAIEAKKYIGKTVTVLGKVVDARYLGGSGRQPTLLNIDKAFPNQEFTVVIYGDGRKTFGYKPEEALLNKNISVSGKITMYNGKAQMEVASPDQIVIATAASNLANIKDNKLLANGEIIMKSVAKLRSGPGLDYKSIAKLKPGSTVKILNVDGNWSYVLIKRISKNGDADNTLVGFINNKDLNE
jgi:hypothetical protein